MLAQPLDCAAAGHLGRGLLSDPASHGPGFDAGPGVNHYEKTSVLLNRHRPGAGLGGEAGLVGGANTVYHMGTISRAAVTKQISQNNADKNQQVVTLIQIVFKSKPYYNYIVD